MTRLALQLKGLVIRVVLMLAVWAAFGGISYGLRVIEQKLPRTHRQSVVGKGGRLVNYPFGTFLEWCSNVALVAGFAFGVGALAAQFPTTGDRDWIDSQRGRSKRKVKRGHELVAKCSHCGGSTPARESNVGFYLPCAKCGQNFKVKRLKQRAKQGEAEKARGISLPEVYLFGYSAWRMLTLFSVVGIVSSVGYLAYSSGLIRSGNYYKIIDKRESQVIQVYDAEGNGLDSIVIYLEAPEVRGHAMGGMRIWDDYEPADKGEFKGTIRHPENSLHIRGRGVSKWATLESSEIHVRFRVDPTSLGFALPQLHVDSVRYRGEELTNGPPFDGAQ